MNVDHYMVDFEDADGVVRFANDVPMQSLAKAKALARKTSKKHGCSYVVAYVPRDGNYSAVGHVSFLMGYQGGIDGMVQ